MAYRVDYKSVEEVSQKIPVPPEHSENQRNFEGIERGYPPPCDIATDDLDAWSWATHIAHQDAGYLLSPEAYRFFYLWNCELEGV